MIWFIAYWVLMMIPGYVGERIYGDQAKPSTERLVWVLLAGTWMPMAFIAAIYFGATVSFCWIADKLFPSRGQV